MLYLLNQPILHLQFVDELVQVFGEQYSDIPQGAFSILQIDPSRHPGQYRTTRSSTVNFYSGSYTDLYSLVVTCVDQINFQIAIKGFVPCVSSRIGNSCLRG